MGSNGAGKSTLAKILCGLTPMDAGSISLDGHPYEPRDKQHASSVGIVMVMQELNLLPTLSVAENLFFHDLPTRFGFVDRTALRENAEEALKRVKLDQVDPDTPAGKLGVGRQQLVEIAAALTQKCRILILDEPTAALTDPEIETLFTQIRILAAQGVAIIYVSHRLDEIQRISDRVTVMRDGRRISTSDTRDISSRALVSEMAGKEIWTSQRKSRDLSQSPVVFEAKKLSAPPLVQELSFQLRQGEILGLAGLVGSGRTECLRALFGADPSAAGEILVKGELVHLRHPSDAIAVGIGMIPEDRKEHGLLLPQSIRVNAGLATHDLYSKFGYMIPERERQASEEGCRKLDVKHDHVEQSINQLSGGNQQKVVLLRWLLRGSEILLLDEPTRGVDVAAKESIYRVLRGLAEQGKSILIVSSELLELMALCDRIAVFSGGRIREEFTPESWTQEAITEAAFSAYLKDAS